MDEFLKIFFTAKRGKSNSTKLNFSKIKIGYLRKVRITKSRKKPNVNYLKYKDRALLLAKNRLEYFNTFYNFKYNNVSIRNQKTRWGSCSKKGNLSFNYKIVLLPPVVADYIIIHELCHVGEFNHSKNFWDLVSKTMPDYKEVRESLKKKDQIVY